MSAIRVLFRRMFLLARKPLCLHFAVAVLLSVGLVAAPEHAFAQAQDGFTYNGMVYLSYQADEYLKTPQGLQNTGALRSTGANYAAVLATQYEQTSTSNVIAPETTSTPGYNSSLDPLSPTDAAVSAAIANLQAQGLIVVMKPQVDSLDGVFRGQFAPADPAAWFASYTTFLTHYAQLASSHGVGILIIGTELKSLSGVAYVSYWNTLIAQLRASYPNLLLIYAANATSAGDEFTTVSFWSKVDIIGVDGYFPLTNQTDPTLAQLVAAWTNNRNGFNALAALKQLQLQYNKPLIFTELGYVSAAGTNEAPYALAAQGAPYDAAEQQNCYEAFFQVFSQQSSWMKGVFWWEWNVSPPSSGDLGYTPQNKPAGNMTLPKWYGSTTPSFTLAAANPLLTVRQGQTASTVVAVTNLGGFTGTPALTATGLPTGVTAAFVTGTAPGTQSLTLTASTAAAAGSAAVSVTGTAGSLSAVTVLQLSVVGTTAQTISFTDPGTQTAGSTLALSAAASSGLPVTFGSTTPAVCTVTGSAATLATAGTCTLTADQPGNTSYAAAPQVQQSFSVSAAQSFTLSTSPTSIALSPGGTGTSTVTITPAGGFSGGITLSAGNLPAGVTASFGSNPATGSTSLTLMAASTAAAGSTIVTITGQSGSLTSSTSVTVVVQAPPTLTIVPTSATLTAHAGATATDVITVAGNSSFSGGVLLTATITASPAGAQYPPTVSFGNTGSVTLAAGGSGSGTLTITTTAPTSGTLRRPRGGPASNGDVALTAALILLPFAVRRRRHAAPLLLVLGVLALGGMTGCGGAHPAGAGSTSTNGTTAGSYTITVTATAGNGMTSAPITFVVQ